MKFTAKRSLVAGAVGLAAIVTPLSLTVALAGSGPASIAGATTGTPASPDKILYGQTPSTYYEYVPGNGNPTTTHPVTSGGGKCKPPTDNNANGAILSITAKEYAPSPNTTNYYLNPSSAATPGISGGQTGVCSISPAYTIDNKSGTGAEALDFAPGTDTTDIGSNRVFTEAQIPIQRKDSGVAQNPVLTVQLAEFDTSGNQVGTQNCAINGGEATQITADTSGNANCTGGLTSQTVFETVEVRDATTSTSISVVGPAATFTLGSVVCGGQSIQDSGTVPATLTLTGTSTQCKSYTTFNSGPNASGQQQVNFDGFSAGSVPFTVTITWPAEPLCQPYPFTFHPDASSTPIPPAEQLPACAPHEFSLDGTTFYDQSYCQAPVPPGPGVDPEASLCTTNKTFNNVNPANGQPIMTTGANPVAGTQIVETWTGDIDWNFR
jgi:hypothetical protein